MTGIILQLILSVGSKMINKKKSSSAYLQEILSERQNEVFQVRIKNGKGGHYFIKDGKVSFSRKLHSSPSFEQVWNSGIDAIKALTSNDTTIFLKTFEQGKYDVKGDFSMAIWFNEVMKLARG